MPGESARSETADRLALEHVAWITALDSHHAPSPGAPGDENSSLMCKES